EHPDMSFAVLAVELPTDRAAVGTPRLAMLRRGHGRARQGKQAKRKGKDAGEHGHGRAFALTRRRGAAARPSRARRWAAAGSATPTAIAPGRPAAGTVTARCSIAPRQATVPIPSSDHAGRHRWRRAIAAIAHAVSTGTTLPGAFRAAMAAAPNQGGTAPGEVKAARRKAVAATAASWIKTGTSRKTAQGIVAARL